MLIFIFIGKNEAELVPFHHGGKIFLVKCIIVDLDLGFEYIKFFSSYAHLIYFPWKGVAEVCAAETCFGIFEVYFAVGDLRRIMQILRNT